MARVLIVDDDPISLRFLAAAVEQTGLLVETAASARQALHATQAGRFDLLLIDCHLPDANGSTLLAQLRALHLTAPAIATSAELDARRSAALRGDGFVDTLEKPATLQRIRAILAMHLGDVVLDDDAACAASGSIDTVRALRRMLASELETLESELTARGQPLHARNLRERLHRLQAACGFCGARGLATATQALQDALHTGVIPSLEDFLRVCRATARALRRQSAP